MVRSLIKTHMVFSEGQAGCMGDVRSHDVIAYMYTCPDSLLVDVFHARPPLVVHRSWTYEYTAGGMAVTAYP